MTVAANLAMRARKRRFQVSKKEPTEAQIQSAVIKHWQTFGVLGSLVAAIPNQKAFGQPGLTKGLPDLLVVREGFVGFIELKAVNGRVSMAQNAVLGCLAANKIPCAVARGRDEPISILREWGIVR